MHGNDVKIGFRRNINFCYDEENSTEFSPPNVQHDNRQISRMKNLP